MAKIFLLPALFLIGSLPAFSQPCKVKIKAIDSLYVGDCKKGTANGKGTASGTDTYTGDFKNGLPDGKGKYSWQNGDWYQGEWEKGLRSGMGTMHYLSRSPTDSMAGFWSKDNYKGKYENPYLIHSITHTISKLDVNRDESSQLKEITFVVESITGGSKQVSGSVIEKPKVTNIEVVSGLFVQQYDQDFNLKRTSTTLRMVQFPFRTRVTMGTDVLDIEVLEEGKWTIEIKLQR